MVESLRLGVNIDHVATLRNARGGIHPDPVEAALLAKRAGADGITAHLREDRRHIRDDDIRRLKDKVDLPLNFEMAATNEMIALALEIKPNACCLVPERREELTTEGGLDVLRHYETISGAAYALKQSGIRVSLFIDADIAQLDAAKKAGADIVELHTGHYCETRGTAQAKALRVLQHCAESATQMGVECHAGHGLSFDTVAAVAVIPQIVELNIGHFLIGDAVFQGLEASIREMRRLMDDARKMHP